MTSFEWRERRRVRLEAVAIVIEGYSASVSALAFLLEAVVKLRVSRMMKRRNVFQFTSKSLKSFNSTFYVTQLLSLLFWYCSRGLYCCARDVVAD